MLMLCHFQVDHLVVSGDYEVVVGVHSFSNPSGRCEECHSLVDSRPRCCDANSFMPSCPTPTCDTRINFCFRPHGQPGLGCPGKLIQPASFFTNTNNFTFGSNFFVSVTLDGAWMVIDS